MQKRVTLSIIVSAWILMAVGCVWAQEASIQHGFLFFAGEKYTMDERTYGIYEDGNLFSDLIKDNAVALDEFNSYETWHTTALVLTGLSLASAAFGGVYYMFEKDMSDALGENAGLYGFAAGGGLLILSFVTEFIAWGSISSSAETYNQGLMEEGPGLSMSSLGPMIAFNDRGLQLGWGWRF